MENLNVMVLRALRDWRAAGRSALPATVVRTWGSSPRPAGSIMALCEDGSVIGSVSGGCIEDDLIHRHAGARRGPGPEIRNGVTLPGAMNIADSKNSRQVLTDSAAVCGRNADLPE